MVAVIFVGQERFSLWLHSHATDRPLPSETPQEIGPAGRGSKTEATNSMKHANEALKHANEALNQASASVDTWAPPIRAVSWSTGVAQYEASRRFLGRAFAGTAKVDGEPTLAWILSRKDFAHVGEDKNSEHVKIVTFMVSFAVRDAVRHGAVQFSTVMEDGTVAAQAVAYEYDPERMRPTVFSRFMRKSRETVDFFVIAKSDGLPSAMKSGDKEHRNRAREVQRKATAVFDRMPDMHAQYGPKEKHWYFFLIGTSPEAQGLGYGSELMRKLAELADAHKMVSYLECSSVKNRDFYQKFGFQVVQTLTVHDPSDHDAEPLTWYLMVRDFKS
ncbi:Puromycin N-acetyltransferase [Porphyridium purpureum]|uniref:Puromycin N-acetyltransferase n=1 Tax=Porphyridium purpureum TaxID=35688 RepID=A0A5J4Z677_PORPP|nr:Puromycin N-acetyltransferase [Porphyridium purpureum]|eukprot:POR1733..scf295_1